MLPALSAAEQTLAEARISTGGAEASPAKMLARTKGVDATVTTTGALSRNRSLGLALAAGETLASHTATHRSVAEGANTARAALALAARYAVELPICAEVAAILFEGKSPRQVIGELMERSLKAESWR